MFVAESYRTYGLLLPHRFEWADSGLDNARKEEVNAWLLYHLLNLARENSQLKLILPAEETPFHFAFTKFFASISSQRFDSKTLRLVSFESSANDTYVKGKTPLYLKKFGSLISSNHLLHMRFSDAPILSGGLKDTLKLRDQALINELVDNDRSLYYGGLIAVHGLGVSDERIRAGMKYAYNKGIPILSLDASSMVERRTLHEERAKALTGHSRPAYSVPYAHTDLPVVDKNLCPYCGGKIEQVTAAKHYNSSSYQGYVIRCRDCDSYVGMHNKTGGQPVGTLANRKLRKLRMSAHDVFDKYWLNQKHNRPDCYKLLGYFLNVHPDKAHIGHCNERDCLKIIEGFDDFMNNEAKYYTETYLKVHYGVTQLKNRHKPLLV